MTYKRGRPIIAFRPNSALGMWFPSAIAATRYMGLTPNSLLNPLQAGYARRGWRKRAGWCWRYVE